MDADEDLDQLEALANSIDDSSSSSSDSEDESMEIDKKYIAKEITIGIEKDELDTSSEIEDSNDIEPEKEKNPTNVTSDNIVCVDMPGKLVSIPATYHQPFRMNLYNAGMTMIVWF